MERYLTIGEMGKMFHISSQTLHFYDKEKIFVPEYRDEKTGYRGYAFGQIYGLALICYLRKIGFSIEQIKNYMNLRNTDMTMRELKKQSEALKLQYRNILNLDSAVQRKIKFVEEKLELADLDSVTVRHFPRRAYIPLGEENVLYHNEIFYFYPTIAFYYGTEAEHYDKTFGAYLEPTVMVSAQDADKIRFIEEQDFLCFYHRGAYAKMEETIKPVRASFCHLPLSRDTINFNIVDQFLEKNMDQYVTEVQIPLLKNS